MSPASTTSASAAADSKPERSRNARAQARHRAKRKAYIEQLEQTVTKLQAALGYSTEQVAGLPQPSITLRELQLENSQQQKEIEDLRRALAEATGARRGSVASPYDRTEYKRRKMSSHLDTVYMGHPGESHHLDSRPPPLTIPGSQYGTPVSSSNGSSTNGALFSMHSTPLSFPPNTPSGSSATSSPPFSPMQPHSLDQRPLSSSMSSAPYSHSGHYSGPVKVEDDNYNHSNGHHSSSMPSYSYSSQTSHASGTTPLEWQSYSSGRAQLTHR